MFADPVSAVAVATAVTAITATYGAVNANQQAQHAKGAAQALASQQDQQLKDESNAAATLAATQAITGQTFGKEADVSASGLGFGTAKPTTARASLTGFD